jgi:outer membrane protein, heavy metal efflux system
MNSNLFKLLISLFFVFWTYTLSHGQEYTDKSIAQLSLQESIDLALELNPGLNSLKNTEQEIANTWKKESGIVNPEIFFYQNGIGENDIYFERAIGISQNIEKPLANIWHKKAANIEMEKLNFSIELYKLSLKALVKAQYVEILYAIYYRDLVKERIETYTHLVEAVELKFENGSANKLEVLNANVRLSQAENEYSKAESNLHRQRYYLFEIIGLEPESQVYEISFADSLRTHESFIQQEDVLTNLPNYPGIKVEEYKILASEEKLKSSKAKWFPSFSVSYLRQDFSSGFEFNGIEVGLEIPIWGKHTISSDIKVQESILSQHKWHYTGVELMYKRQLEDAWHSYENAKKVVDNFNETQSKNTRELLDLSEEAYLIGEIDLIVLLDAQNLYINNQEIYLNALRDYYLYLIELEKFTDYELVY